MSGDRNLSAVISHQEHSGETREDAGGLQADGSQTLAHAFGQMFIARIIHFRNLKKAFLQKC